MQSKRKKSKVKSNVKSKVKSNVKSNVKSKVKSRYKYKSKRRSKRRSNFSKNSNMSDGGRYLQSKPPVVYKDEKITMIEERLQKLELSLLTSVVINSPVYNIEKYKQNVKELYEITHDLADIYSEYQDISNQIKKDCLYHLQDDSLAKSLKYMVCGNVWSEVSSRLKNPIFNHNAKINKNLQAIFSQFDNITYLYNAIHSKSRFELNCEPGKYDLQPPQYSFINDTGLILSIGSDGRIHTLYPGE